MKMLVAVNMGDAQAAVDNFLNLSGQFGAYFF